MHCFFEERAKESPEHLAVSTGGVSLSYGELNARAERLARHLRRLGVGPESLVALLLERSPGLILAALATHKAGGAYLPVDPAQPAERIRYILEDSGARVLVTTEPILGRFPGLCVPSGLVILDRVPGEDSGPPAVEPDADNLAYVIYTSGSTGAPKGAELRHRGLSNVVAWNRAHYGLRPGERVSMVASPGFDASVWEMWPALTAGASLHLPPLEVVLSPAKFLPWAAQEGITVAFLPTPIAEAVLDEPIPPALRLRVLQTAGDRLLRRPAPGLPFEVSNVYGPTEASIVVTAARVSPTGDRPPHIGRAVANVRTHVLDPGQFPVAPGAEGELCLGGECVGRGYLRRPDLTAERFIPDPFSPRGGDRLYRTGDLVRSLPSGDLEFLGRIDQQIKIRGNRVELGEIEAALVRHPAVREAAVILREGRLVAFIAFRPGEKHSGEALQEFLGLSLPEVMVPRAWSFLDTLPLTSNGKIDRKALAGIEPGNTGVSSTASVLPRTSTQAALAEIWAQVLGLGSVGITDDFFALGGHSLLASRVAARVRDAFGADPGLRGLFDHPTVAALAEWLEQQSGEPGAGPRLATLRHFGPAPLSFAQQRLWFMERLRPGTAVYNLAQFFDLRGELSVSALAMAFDGVVRRHDSLRTRFVPASDGAVQLVSPPTRVSIPVIDLGALPEPLLEADRLALEEARRPYDLERGSLRRAALLRLGGGEHRLLLGMHHIVSDGWSFGVLMRELSDLYSGKALPQLPVQVPDFAVWQRGWLAAGLAETQVAWWRESLAGAPTVLELPSDRPRPAELSYRGERLRLALGEETALAAFSRSQGCTLFMTLLAAFQALLHRWSGQEDMIVGSPVAGRDRLELEGLIGFFVNMLPLRADLSADPDFGQLLGGVRDSVLGAFAHQDLPFDHLVEALSPKRDASRMPLVQVAFAIQDAPLRPDFGVEVTAAAEVNTGTSRFDLILFVERGPAGLDAIGEYACDLFDRDTVQRMLGAFRALLAEAVARPNVRVGELSLLSAEERAQVVSAGSQVLSEVPDRPVHRLFEESAALAPNALAVASAERSLTYGELERQANRLAHRLRRLGVGPEVLVAFLLERSQEMVAAALAALKAGGAYLPIDPAYPAERAVYILRDADPRVLITTERILAGLPEVPLPADQILLLDGELAPGESEEPPRVEVEPESLAYVIYTSGSTGAPKGTELRHRGLSNLAAWQRAFYRLGPADRLSLVAAPGFDAVVLEMWSPLTCGASLHVAPREVVLSPAAFMSWLAEHRVTVAFLPTPLAESVLAEPAREGMMLRALLTGGDRLRRRPATDLPFALSNLYGPTESTVVATAGWVQAHGHRAPHIGRAVANTRASILDRGLGLVPAGVPGELFLAGEGLARGYRGRPDLTAYRFVPDPFGGPGARLYRTGDLARRLPSGDIEFIGRVDHQVKIRGYRIELGEIEAALSRHPEVRDAAVLVRDGRLVAYIALWKGDLGSDELRAFLAGFLPDVMIPSSWAFVEALPVTPNGKVDRRALARIEPAPESRTPSVRPRTPLETAVAEVWSALLGVEGVGAFDDFFALGGHSLLATRLAASIHERLGIELPLRVIFQEPTVAGLAAWIGAGSIGSAHAAGIGGAAAPLSFAQQRLWFLDRLEPGSAAYNVPVLLTFSGSLRPEILKLAVAEIVRRHAALRTTFEIPEGVADPVQAVHPPVARSLLVLDLSGLPVGQRDHEAVRLTGEEARRPFDLRRGPLLRATLLRVDESEHRLLVTMHHIVSDGASVEVLQRELEGLYPAFAEGRPSPLPELPMQYPDFAVWQQGWLSGTELERQLSYWRGRLAAAPVFDLPADRPRPAVWSYRGAVEEAELPRSLAEDLERLGKSCGATPFMTLLAAFFALLRRYTAQEDLLIGAPVSGRGRADIEGLIGFFVNTLPLRVGLEGEPTFLNLIARVRESTLAAYAHQDLPFEKLVAELAHERDLSRNPLFQVIFAFLDGWDPVAIGPGLTMGAAQAVHSGTAKFDLSFHVSRSAGGLRLWLEYATDLFDHVTIHRLAGHFHRLLEGALDHPEVPIARLPLLTEAEQAQLSSWERDARRDHPEGLLHGLFEAQARRTPEAVALVAGGTVLTYVELEERSARLAQRLRALGAGPEIGVAVCLERTAGLVVALLAVLRAGSYYVPLDPRYPVERLSLLVEDSGAQIMVSESGAAANLFTFPVRWLLLDRPETAVEPMPAAPASELTARNLAYLIYTSGSTGRPKAVAIEHRSATVLAHWAREEFSAEELRGVLASTAVTFDLSVFELFVTLAWGGTVVLAENALELPRVTAALPAGVEVTLVNTVPSAMAELLREDNLPSSVRTINLAGEALPRWLADRAYARPETARLLNLYGPSEDTTYSTWTVVGRSTDRAPSIGRPVHDTRVYILDPWLERLPIGVPGELCVAGAGLARGYLGRPELTAERFMPDPGSPEPGARMYRTGDLARLLADGELDYLGRLDHQVKVRGFRIELGEVETALTRQPGVEKALVLVREDVPGDKRLVAYVVATGETSAAGLRLGLQRDLPEPMLPSAFVYLDAFPLTLHGKVDRRSLPAPDVAHPATSATFVAPRTPLEEEVAQVWADVLGVDCVGVYDNFWNLGGHSLLATRALSRLESSFGVTLPLRTLFASPTLEGFASLLGERVLAGESSEDLDATLAALGEMSEDEVRALLEQTVRELEELA